MLNAIPVGQERLFIPVNPVRPREVYSTARHPKPRRIESLAPARATLRRRDRGNTKWFYLLSVETRRSLLDLEHPLNGPHPTD